MRARGETEPPAERGALTREQVVRAALELLDEVGLAGLSMRGLADRLGVKAASLYWHLRDKEQLLDLLSEAIFDEVPEPGDGPWRPALDTFAHGYRRVLLAHRDAARMVAGLRRSPAALARFGRLTARLEAAGFPAAEADAAAVLLVGLYVPAFVADEAAAAPPTGGGDYGAPLEAVESALLRIEGGASGLAIRGDPDLRDLFAARFEGRQPRIEAARGVVTIGVGHGTHGGDVVLNAAVPWDVEVTGGARRLSVDLEGAHVRSLVVGGGASDVVVSLGHPDGTVPVRIHGGVSKVVLRRPPGAPVRVRIRSGASRLALDDLYFGSVGGETRWQSPDFAAAEDRYDLEIMGGASRLTVSAGGVAAPGPGGERQAPPGAEGVAETPAAPDMDARFRFGLEVLLDGLEGRLRLDSSNARS